jgi:hypothetical protein
MLGALASRYRRWKYEEDLGTPLVPEVSYAGTELLRTRQAIAIGERRLADYRRVGCIALARDCENQLRSLRGHLAALEF